MYHKKLKELVSHYTKGEVGPELAMLVGKIRHDFKGSLCAIVYYGACLRHGDPYDGLVDLYVIVKDYRSAYGRLLPAVANGLLSPNVYYLEQSYQGRTIRVKYAVLSMATFLRGTTGRWFHSYLWGRFSQPVKLLYARNTHISAQINHALVNALLKLSSETLPIMESGFNVIDFWTHGLHLSYRAELRVESSNRSKDLVNSHLSFYKQVMPLIMMALPYQVILKGCDGEEKYFTTVSGLHRNKFRIIWNLRIMQGKLLSLLRLLKGLFTFAPGLDYAVKKIERHTGRTIHISSRVRRHPMLFVWGLCWRLYRKGILN